MAYSPRHKPATRQKILRAANRLFAVSGYEGTSIDEIMSACGLTRGGFYAHFASKAQLYREACSHGAWLEAMLSEYLETSSPAGKPSPECAFPAGDIASKTPEVRAAFAAAFSSISRKRSCSRPHDRVDENIRLSAAALVIGALAIAQTTDDQGLKDKVYASCKETAATLLIGSQLSTATFFWEPTLN
jgi:TetR/AcrR family transcriptional repressor of nem operon